MLKSLTRSDLTVSIAAPDATPSESKTATLRSSRKRAGDFNDLDPGEFESVAIADTPTETKSTKPSKKRKTTKEAGENLQSIAQSDHQVETEKIFPGGDRVEVEPATTSKRGRKPGKKAGKSEAFSVEAEKSSGKPTESKTFEKPLDGGKQPAASDDKDEEPADVAKETPKRRGRPKKQQVEPKADVQSVEPTRPKKAVSAKEITQNLPKPSKSRRSGTKELAEKEPAEEEPAALEPVSKSTASKEPAVTKKPVAKEPTKKESAKKEPTKKELAKKGPAKEESAKEEPAKKEPAKKETAKKEASKKEPAKKEAAKKEPAKQEPAKQEPTKKEPAKKAVAKKESAQKESKKTEPVTKAATPKEPAPRASASRATVSKASATQVPALEEPSTDVRNTEKPSAEERVIEGPDTAELVAKKPASNASKGVTKGEKVRKTADLEVSATSKTSRGRKANKDTEIAEPPKDGPKSKTSKKANDSAKATDAAKDVRSHSGEVASSSKGLDPSGTEIERSGNDQVTSEAPNSKKRKTPPGADPDAIRQLIDPLSELESTKKKQRKGLPTSLKAAKSKIGDLVAPVVDTVKHGVQDAKDLAAEVQSSILEDVTAMAEEAADTKADEAGASKESGEPVAKNIQDKGKDKSKGREKGKERVRALSKEAEPAPTFVEDTAVRASEANPATTTQGELEDKNRFEIVEQAQTSLTAVDDGPKEPTDSTDLPHEHPRRPYQSTLVEVSGISTVVTTVVQGGQL